MKINGIGDDGIRDGNYLQNNSRSKKMEDEHISVTLHEIEIIKHTLGYDYMDYSFRNDFVTYPTSPDGKICEELVKKGLMDKSQDYMKRINPESQCCLYYCTQKGKDFIMRTLGYNK